MNPELSSFATRLCGQISDFRFPISDFPAQALELFVLQFKHNSAYRKICEARRLTPQVVEHWTQIPAVPTAAFKELELTSLAPGERTAVFHSSGTTEQTPSRHFHNAESLAVYKASLWTWFERNILWSAGGPPASCEETGTRGRAVRAPLLILTPLAALVPDSSLVHMFEIVRQKMGEPESAFTGSFSAAGAWTVDFAATIHKLDAANDTQMPLTLLGTAFSFVHLLDYLASKDLVFNLPAGSLVMETGGYKNRSRTLPKDELHTLITERLGVPRENIVCEYGMSELSSQAYEDRSQKPEARSQKRVFHLPPWARLQIISPETGREAGEGETGLIRVLDLANVFSVAAIQTEDLAIRRGDGFELVGRAQLAEPRGCSLMTA